MEEGWTIKKIDLLVIAAILIAFISFVVIKDRETLPSRKFCMAVHQNDINTINELLDRNWNVNAYSNLIFFPIAELNVRYLPLNEACLYSSSAVVEKLLMKGANPNGGIYKSGWSPVSCAFLRARHNGYLETKMKLKLLIEYGADLTLLEGRFKPTSLLSLVIFDDTSEQDKEIVVEMLKLMLDNGAVYDEEEMEKALKKVDMDWAFEYLMEGRTPTNG